MAMPCVNSLPGFYPAVYQGHLPLAASLGPDIYGLNQNDIELISTR